MYTITNKIAIVIFTVIFTGCNTQSTTLSMEAQPEQNASVKSPHIQSAKNIFTAGDDQNVLEGSAVTLSASLLDKNKEFQKVEWKEGDTTLWTGNTFETDHLSAGTHTISLIMTDKEGNQYEDTVTVTIKAPSQTNTPPKAVSFSIQTSEDASSETKALLGSDIDGDALTYLLVTQPKHGRLSGSYSRLRYTPDTNFNGTDSFLYKTNDGEIDSDIATVTIHVSAVNDAPIAYDDNVTLNEDSNMTIALKANDVDANDTLTFTYTQPTHGSFDGKIYTPDKDFNGKDSFTFTATDLKALSSNATINLNIINTNDAPIANDDTNSTFEDNNIILNLLKNDSDIDPHASLTIRTIFNAPAYVSFTPQGNLTLSPSGYFDNLIAGETYPLHLRYQIQDEHNATAEANVTILVKGLNDAPQMTSDNSITIDEDTQSLPNRFIAYDEDNQTLMYDANDSLITFTDTYGRYMINTDGNYNNIPEGKTKIIPIMISVSDGTQQIQKEINVTIKGKNNTPTFTQNPLAVIQADEDSQPFSNTILASDADDQSQITFSKSTNLIGFTLHPSGHYDVNLTSEIYQRLNENDTITKTLPITITDDKGAASTQPLTIMIAGVNDAPIAYDDALNTDEDHNITINLLANDRDMDSNHTLTLNTNDINNSSQDGNFTFSPIATYQNLKEGEKHPITLHYTMHDEHNATSNTASIPIMITGKNDAPTAQQYQRNVAETSSVSLQVAFTENDVYHNASLKLSDIDHNASVTIKDATFYEIVGSNVYESTKGEITLSSDKKSLTFNTLDDFSYLKDTNASAFITYTLRDEYNASSTAKIDLTIIGKDTKPTFTQDSSTIFIDENETYASGYIVVSDAESPLTYAFSNETNTTFLSIDNQGHYTFRPDDKFYEYLTDTLIIPITIEISDGTYTLTKETNITIRGTNNPPVADFDVLSVASNTIQVDASKSHDAESSITYSWSEGSTNHGTAKVIDISATSGEHNITLTVTDAQGKTSTLTKTVTVSATSPVINTLATLTTTEDSQDLTGQITPTNGSGALTFSTVSSLAGFSLSPDGHYTFKTATIKEYQKLQAGSISTRTVKVKIVDALKQEDTKTITLKIQGLNDAPIANPDSNSTDENGTITFNILDNDTDIDTNDALTLLEVNATQGEGNVTFDAFGHITFNPNGMFDYLAADKNATTTLTYKIQDISGASSESNVTITIIGHNTAPTDIMIEDINISEDTNSTLHTISYHDSDSNATFSIAPESNGSYLNLETNGTYSFTPTPKAYDYLAAGSSITRTIMIEIKDGELTITKPLTITIKGENDAPLANNDAVSISQNQNITIDVLANDTDVDIHDTKTIVSVTDTHVTISANKLIFTPNHDYDYLRAGTSETLTFTYTMKDASGETSSATVTVTIQGINDPISLSMLHGLTQVVKQGESIIMTAQADTRDTAPNFSYLWSIDGTTQSNTSAILTISGLEQGTHDIQCIATDITSSLYATTNVTLTVTPNNPFEYKNTLSDVNEKILSIQLADLDKDGDVDILGTTADEVFWYENNNDETYNYTKHSISLGVTTRMVKTADIDHDGYLDVVFGYGSVHVCFNDKNKAFDCTRDIRSGSTFKNKNKNQLYSGFSRDDTINSLTIGDFYNDGEVDFLLSSNEDNKGRLYFYNQNNTLFPSSPKTIDNNLAISMYIDSADINYDGFLDMVGISKDKHIQYYKNNATDTISFTTTTINDTTPTTLSIENIDTLGTLDIVATYQDNIHWYDITDSTNHHGVVDADITNPPYAATVDIDDDGDMDIVSNSNEANGQILWYENNNANFTKHIIAENASFITITQAADLDNDGDIDIVSADNSGNIFIYVNISQ